VTVRSIGNVSIAITASSYWLLLLLVQRKPSVGFLHAIRVLDPHNCGSFPQKRIIALHVLHPLGIPVSIAYLAQRRDEYPVAFQPHVATVFSDCVAIAIGAESVSGKTCHVFPVADPGGRRPFGIAAAVDIPSTHVLVQFVDILIHSFQHIRSQRSSLGVQCKREGTYKSQGE
jgi:hypothetical protein